MKSLLLFITLFASFSAFGQAIFNDFERDSPIERIFIVGNTGIDCSGKTNDGQNIANLTESILLGSYDILERRHFEQILDEQRLAASGILLEETAVELGCNAGSQGIIFTEVGCLDGMQTINIKLVGCESSEIYWSCVGIGVSALETLNKINQSIFPQNSLDGDDLLNNTSLPTPHTVVNSKTVYRTLTGNKYHQGSCRFLSKSKITIDKEGAENLGLSPCGVCKP